MKLARADSWGIHSVYPLMPWIITKSLQPSILSEHRFNGFFSVSIYINIKENEHTRTKFTHVHSTHDL